ncbi:MAG: hypothetical protein ACMUIP_02295 [bacterium]
MIKVSTLKSLIWFSAMLLLILSFPIQVKLMSQWPALFPYLLIGLVFFLPYCRPADIPKNWVRPKRMEQLIGFYFFLVVFHTSWQVLLGFISPYQAGTAIFVYGVPVFFYWYFSRRANLVEIRAVLFAILFAGLVSGVFHAYDNISKLGFGKISNFSKEAIMYSALRGQEGGTFEDVSSARAICGYRSFGLLETHTISSACTVFAVFAALALLPLDRKRLRFVIILVFGFMLLLGLTFTSIVAFWITILMLEFRLIVLVKARLPKNIFRILPIVVFMILVFIVSISVFFNEAMVSYISQFFTEQFQLATVGRNNLSYIGIFVNNAIGYLHNLVAFPPTLLIGDGYSSFGLKKGGDVGYIESLVRFGAPFFMGAVIGLFVIVWKSYKNALRRGKYLPDNVRSLMLFSANVIFFLLIMELHYSTWNAKAILPILFFALALYSRYRYRPNKFYQTTAIINKRNT